MADSLQNLTIKQERAALLVAEDELSDEAIAAEIGITRETLHQWKKREMFAARVAEHVEAFKDKALTEGFADKRARLKALDGLAQDMLRHFRDKGYEREEVKIAANGEHVSYWLFDQGRVAQFRGALDDIASEMGERKTVTEVTGKDGADLVLGLVGVELGRV